jgi:RNA polymerase-binding transcription factor
MNEKLEDTPFQEFKLSLKAKLAELQELNKSGEESRRPVILDQSTVGRLSRMDALQGQQMAAETARRRTLEMQRIRAALLRIEKEEYGYCLRCEEDIAKKRLETDPAATLCIQCARG